MYPRLRKRGEHSTSRPAICHQGTSWRAFLVIIAVILTTAGCSSRGEGLTLNSDGLHIGTSLAERDRIARDKSNAEIAQIVARTELEQDRTAAGIDQAAAMAKVTRPVVLALGVAAAVAVVAIGIGYAGQRAAPLAAEGVEALRASLEIRKARRLEVVLQIGPGGYNANLTAIGYEPAEIARIVQAAPALDAPRLQELQGRVGDRGMRLLAERGEVEETLALLPAPVIEEVISDE